ncbi:MAG: YceI family protein [Cloacibacterium sp.]|nr:YceI family protein [Cloacibacterium sp.]
MRKSLNKIAILALTGSLLAISCTKDKPVQSETKEVATAQGKTYVVDTKSSSIEWKGYKVFKSENTSHFGTMNFVDSEVSVNDNKLVAGKFIADAKSLTNVDLKDDKESSDKLNGHLKSPDFFDVEKFPTATFEITKVTDVTTGDYNSTIEGNLTIKDITKPVKFNANISVKDGNLTIATEPTDINREDFGVKFKAPLENGVIKNEITLQILVKASEKK